MSKQPLTELLQDLEQEMLRLGYQPSSMQFYRQRWKKLLQFAQQQQTIFYSEKLGMDFVETNFHLLEKMSQQRLSQSDTQELRVIRMIGDFQLHHTILRRYYKHHLILTEPGFIKINAQFKLYRTYALTW